MKFSIFVVWHLNFSNHATFVRIRFFKSDQAWNSSTLKWTLLRDLSKTFLKVLKSSWTRVAYLRSWEWHDFSMNIIKFSLQKHLAEMVMLEKLDTLYRRPMSNSTLKIFKEPKRKRQSKRKVSKGLKSFEFYFHKSEKLFLLCTCFLYLGKAVLQSFCTNLILKSIANLFYSIHEKYSKKSFSG